MNIQEATIKAYKENKYMTLPHEGKIYFKLKPTNTDRNIILFYPDNTEYKTRKPVLSHGWQPNADDLMSDGWLVVD